MLAKQFGTRPLNRCYVCNQNFNGTTVVDHGEHVIQNAIGGGLIEWGILCMSCGTNLGKSVDAPFDAALKSLCAVFDIRRDRGGAIKVPALVTIKTGFVIDSTPVRCSIERGADPIPAAPTVIKDEGAKIAHIFGPSPKQVKGYALSLTVKGLIANGYRIEADSRFSDFVERIALEVRPDGIEVARGVLKIAIAFALHAGVDPSVIRHFIADNRDITADERQIEAAVLPYYPTGWAEALFEADRYRTDDFPPNHQLLLFSHGKRLFCHVDLFGVIQRYVLLSDNWSGEQIVERYLQKCPKWAFDPDDWKARRPKDLHILAQQFGICMLGKSIDDLQREIVNAARSRPYALDVDDHLAKHGRMMEMLVTLPLAQHRSFETTAALRERAEIAETELKSDFLKKLVTDKLSLLTHIRDRDPRDFRICNENGFCPDLSRAVPANDLAAYQTFRLNAFVRAYAGNWSIGLQASPAVA